MKPFIGILFLLVFQTVIFGQNRTGFDPYIAATFDKLNNKPFTEIQLEDTSGQLFNTASLLGKTIYVDFWFTSCAPCLKEIPLSKSLQQFFSSDTNIVFLSICIDNVERKTWWKQMIKKQEMQGVHLFYARNKPQKINLLRDYGITFPTYLLVNKQMKVIGYDAPRPSERGFVHWAIAQAEQGNYLSEAYKQLVQQSKQYLDFINKNRSVISAADKTL